MTGRVPIEDGYFTMPRDGHGPRLLGSYSPAADRCFFPRQRVCPITLEAVEDRELSGPGTLYTWTFVYRGTDEHEGYGVGQVDLPEGPRVQCRLAGRFGDWAVGMPMELDLLPVGSGPDGTEYVTFCFRPAHVGRA